MGREIKRVRLDSDWPLNEVWEGFLMPNHLNGEKCPDCKNGCCGCCIPPGQRPHAVTAACGDEHCTYHQVDEPAGGAYRVCVECGHAFMSEDELRAAFAAAPPGDDVPPPPGDQIDFCPLCAHDF